MATCGVRRSACTSPKRSRQQTLMRHAVDQARGGDVIDERGIGDGEERDAGEHDRRDERRGAADHLGDRAGRLGKLRPRHDRDRGDGDGDIEHRRHAHGEHEAERDGALRDRGIPRRR